jgi:hypothetical protein
MSFACTVADEEEKILRTKEQLIELAIHRAAVVHERDCGFCAERKNEWRRTTKQQQYYSMIDDATCYDGATTMMTVQQQNTDAYEKHLDEAS